MSPTNTILVVEQDYAIREFLAELLIDEGYHTSSVSTGRSGLAALTSNAPALTLFDTAIPDLSVEELIGELQAKGLTGAPLALMSTGPYSAASPLMLGTVAFLTKPFDIDVLLSLVAEHVEPQMDMNGMASETDHT